MRKNGNTNEWKVSGLIVRNVNGGAVIFVCCCCRAFLYGIVLEHFLLIFNLHSIWMGVHRTDDALSVCVCVCVSKTNGKRLFASMFICCFAFVGHFLASRRISDVIFKQI